MVVLSYFYLKKKKKEVLISSSVCIDRACQLVCLFLLGCQFSERDPPNSCLEDIYIYASRLLRVS